MHKREKNNKIVDGFSLVEVSIVIVILGILFTGFLQFLQPQMQAKQLAEQKEKIQTVRMALSDYVIDDPLDPNDPNQKRLPCPAPPFAAFGTADFGVEQCYTGAVGTCSPEGVCRVAGTGGIEILIGSIPSRTIEIGAEESLDVYKNRYLYAVTVPLTAVNSMTNIATSGAIRINQVGSSAIMNAPFVILSHGRNKRGAINLDGNQVNLCATATTGDGENCNADGIFRNAVGETNTGGMNDYDDQILFRFENDMATIATTCPAQTFMTGMSPTGPICSSALAAGMAADIDTNMNAIADECIDGAWTTRAQQIPQFLGGSPSVDGQRTLRFFTTCGARFCINRGYHDGNVIDYNSASPDPTNPNMTVRCRAN